MADEAAFRDMFGEPGPANALAMMPPPPKREEQRQDNLVQRVGLQSQDMVQSDEYVEAFNLMCSVTGDPSGERPLSEASFLALAAQYWGMTKSLASACFHACDLDESGRLHRHEFALLYRSVILFDKASGDNSNKDLVDLRRRIIFTRFAKDPSGTLNADARYQLARALAQGPSHVKHLVEDALGWSHLVQDATGGMDWMDFEHAHTALNEAHMHISDALAPESKSWKTISRESSVRLVLDPRAVLGSAIVTTVDTDTGPQISMGRQMSGFLGDNSVAPAGNGQRKRRRSEINIHRISDADDRKRPAMNSSEGGRKRSANSANHRPEAVNPAFVLDDDLRAPAESDWRGAIAQPRGSPEHKLAQAIVDRAQAMAHRVASEKDVSDFKWMLEGTALAELLGTQNIAEQLSLLVKLAAETKRVATAQPMVVRVSAPAKIFGDVHGQLRDLLLLFAHHGFPSHHGGDVETTAYVFNGDFVDRGAHQLETVALLFALKCLYPARVFLVRGNHEFRSQTRRYGFKEVCDAYPYGQGLYEEVHQAFEWLPLAAIVGGAVAVMHGGVGDGSWALDDLRDVKRPLQEDDDSEIAQQALWSDPSDSDAEMMNGVHPNERGDDIKTFGPDVSAKWCYANHVQLLVRSHQYVREGVKFMHSGRLATVFSARNYCDKYPNDSAFLLIATDEAGALRVRAKRLAHRR